MLNALSDLYYNVCHCAMTSNMVATISQLSSNRWHSCRIQHCGYMWHTCLPNASQSHVIRLIGINLRMNVSMKRVFNVENIFNHCYGLAIKGDLMTLQMEYK